MKYFRWQGARFIQNNSASANEMECSRTQANLKADLTVVSVNHS
jgi:hypothetical protein